MGFRPVAKAKGEGVQIQGYSCTVLNFTQKQLFQLKMRFPEVTIDLKGLPDLGILPVFTCTPFVMLIMGAAPSLPRHMALAVAPCSWETPLAM